ncbi:glycoside hydrolase family 5 protein [Atractiella rhizophila]|nr:glycoside hydrolase family 5 protein [Atractiella rhizophila]
MGNCVSSDAHEPPKQQPESSSTIEQPSGKPHIPAYQPPTLMSEPPQVPFESRPMSRSFVKITQKGELYVETPEGGKKWFRFATLNSPELIDSHEPFEQLDTLRTFLGFGRPVTRCYTLTTKSRNKDIAHVMGWDWDRNVWKLDEGEMKMIDTALAGAGKYDARIIFPIINQDFGSEETNWVGNTRDLIKMRKGVDKWEGVDFWRDRQMIDSFKLLVTQLLNRVNTISKVRYGDDPSILAWETGNELNAFQRPAPASWTLEIAKHIRSLAPNTLVMDGSFARNDDPECCYEKAVLQSPDVHLLSYHYYGSGDIKRVKKDVEICKKYGKGFIAGEFGFFSKIEDYAKFMNAVESAGGQGSLVWSLRPHSAKGGFKTHGEGNGIYSYHVPGFTTYNVPEFDPREKQIVAAIRKASYKINGEAVPPHPTPNAPEVFLADNGSKLVWRGSTWASSYELWVNAKGNAQTGWEVISRNTDAVPEGQLAFELRSILAQKGRDLSFMVRAIGEDGHEGTFSNVLTIGTFQQNESHTVLA